ncbi:dihydropteroate synthase [Deinococcus lacus]|uniref:Dihydropteroate synthase n=1 Tax=Deinococcus lacus TaxID=392561 RepID=A0ABW1YBC8_9DEIO
MNTSFDAAWHTLQFGRPVPGAVRSAQGWLLRWQGCAVMGILNMTPDSFSDGGRYAQLEEALTQARRMKEAGALIIDVGGESTRPGAEPVPAEVEIDRVRPVLTALGGENIVLSIDTLKPEVAQAALEAGAHLVNDVSGLRHPAMAGLCARFGAAACIMHMQGEPGTMQLEPRYSDVVSEVTDYLAQQTRHAQQAGVPGVLVDPGLGFGKTLEHNLALLAALPHLAAAGLGPVLVGASRKRMIEYLAGHSAPADRDPGSLAVHLYAARKGASLVRVHAVGEHVQALRVQSALEAV